MGEHDLLNDNNCVTEKVKVSAPINTLHMNLLQQHFLKIYISLATACLWM